MKNTKNNLANQLILRNFSAFSAGIIFLASTLLCGCGQSSDNPQEAQKDADQDETKSSSATSDEDIEDIDDVSSKKKPKAPKIKLSTTAKKTGKLVDGFVVHQQNEFLGPTVLKIGVPGIRLESSTLTVILPAGKEAIAYNPQNGNCMQLTAKSTAMLAGSSRFGEESKETTTKLGTEKIAGVKCVHYHVHRSFIDKKTKKEMSGGYGSEIWATKDLKLPPSIMKDCARITMMPQELGFPVKVVRDASTTPTEMRRGVKKSRMRREVISTSSFTPSKVDTGEFALLAGYTPVKDEMKLMMSDEEADLGGGLDDLDKDMEK